MKNNTLTLRIDLDISRNDVLDLLIENMNNTPLEFKGFKKKLNKGRHNKIDYFYKERSAMDIEQQDFLPAQRDDSDVQEKDPLEKLMPIKADLHVEALTEGRALLTLELMSPDKNDSTRNKAVTILMHMLAWRIFDLLLSNLFDLS